MQRKSIALGFKDVDAKQGIVMGYFASFGTRDSDGDIIEKGAFAKTINEHGPKSKNPRIKHLLDHDTKKAVAVIQDLREDNFGLYYESKAGRHTNGQDFLLMIEDGIITEHSIGYSVIAYRSEVDEAKKESTWYLEELKLWEGSSLQCWGSNSNTPVEGVKSQKAENIIERMSLLEKAIRNGKYSDDAFPKLEAELKRITDLLKSLDEYKRPGASLVTEPTEVKTILDHLITN